MVVRLEQRECQAWALTGAKAANLCRLAGRYPVTPGFCLTTDAYALWAEAADPTRMPPEMCSVMATACSRLVQQDPTTEMRVSDDPVTGARQIAPWPASASAAAARRCSQKRRNSWTPASLAMLFGPGR